MANKVKISDAIDSTSSVIAASLKAVKQAYDKAVSAQNTANSANSTANSAKTAASNAQSTANTANNTANTANSTANSAASAANSAQNTANNAQNLANSALATAQAAQNSANYAGAICSGVVIYNNQRTITLPGYGTWSWLYVMSGGGPSSGTSPGGTQIYNGNNDATNATAICVRVA